MRFDFTAQPQKSKFCNINENPSQIHKDEAEKYTGPTRKQLSRLMTKNPFLLKSDH